MNHGWQWLREKAGLGRRDGARHGRAARAGVALTLLCVMIGWVFFRAPDTASAAGHLAQHVRLGGDGLPPGALAGYSHGLVAWIAAFSLLALFGRNYAASHRRAPDALARSPRVRRTWHAEMLALMVGAMCVGVVLMAIAAASRTVTEFIYFNF